jgi:hypothetical protein
MSRDLEEFLRMAAARRKAAQGRPAMPPLVEAEVIEEVEIIGESFTPLQSSIKTNIDTRSMEQHASSLGRQVSAADKRVEARIHQKFDHDVSHIHQDKMTESPDANQAPRASGLMEMFANPQTLRQVIIMREILDRPNFD